MVHVLEPVTQERRIEVLESLDKSVRDVRDYALMVILSCIIATFGLVLNSAAVIIGAMLIAPLMSAILLFAMGLVQGDLKMLGHALVTLLLGVGIAVVMSIVLGVLVSASGLNFLEELPNEILSRTRPTLFDLAIALAGGSAGAYAFAQPHLSATLPGVAIATALMPPLCVVGIGLSQQRGDVSVGATLLFLANLVAIVFASCLVFTLVGFGPIARVHRQQIVPRAILLPSLLILVVAVPLGGFLVRIAQDAHTNTVIHDTLIQELKQIGEGGRLVSFEKDDEPDHLGILATIRSPQPLSYAESLSMQREIAARLQQKVALTLQVVPITVLDTLTPPTLTPVVTSTPTPDEASPGT